MSTYHVLRLLLLLLLLVHAAPPKGPAGRAHHHHLPPRLLRQILQRVQAALLQVAGRDVGIEPAKTVQAEILILMIVVGCRNFCEMSSHSLRPGASEYRDGRFRRAGLTAGALYVHRGAAAP